MFSQELLPGGLPAPLGRGLDSMPFEDGGNGTAGQLVSQMRESTLDPALAPVPVLLC